MERLIGTPDSTLAMSGTEYYTSVVQIQRIKLHQFHKSWNYTIGIRISQIIQFLRFLATLFILICVKIWHLLINVLISRIK